MLIPVLHRYRLQGQDVAIRHRYLLDTLSERGVSRITNQPPNSSESQSLETGVFRREPAAMNCVMKANPPTCAEVHTPLTGSTSCRRNEFNAHLPREVHAHDLAALSMQQSINLGGLHHERVLAWRVPVFWNRRSPS